MLCLGLEIVGQGAHSVTTMGEERDLLVGLHALQLQGQEDSDFPWYGCDFVPTAAIDAVRALFTREWVASEQEDVGALDAVMDEVRQQGIVLVDLLHGEVIAEYLLHLDIDGKKGWFRY